ncbi:hypothetical protein SEA_PATELGO_187 [Streptomyces phage Patelgo]|nr:hypothetical protein SEA_PATELGO_187 [Streptomyces phage Patelgo]
MTKLRTRYVRKGESKSSDWYWQIGKIEDGMYYLVHSKSSHWDKWQTYKELCKNFDKV